MITQAQTDNEIFQYTKERRLASKVKNSKPDSYDEIAKELHQLGFSKVGNKNLNPQVLSAFMCSRGERTQTPRKEKKPAVLPLGIMTGEELFKFVVDQKMSLGKNYEEIVELLKNKGVERLDTRNTDISSLSRFMITRGFRLNKKCKKKGKKKQEKTQSRNPYYSKSEAVEQKTEALQGMLEQATTLYKNPNANRTESLMQLYKNREFSIEERESMAKILFASRGE